MFGYGFMQIRVAGIPLAEFVLLVAFLCTNHRLLLNQFLPNIYSIPLVIWWSFGIIHIVWDIQRYGMLSIRDGSHIIESLYIYIGVAFAGRTGAVEQFAKWLPAIIISTLIYSVTYPFRDILQPLSPVLHGVSDQPVSMFFNYTNTPLVLFAAAVYFVQEYFNTAKKSSLLLTISCITVVFLMYPSRTLILEAGMFFVYVLSQCKRQHFKHLILITIIPVVLLSIFAMSGISINGRLGSSFQLQDYMELATEILPGSHSESDDLVSSGNELRYQWWTKIYKDWSSSPSTILFGLGYGMPLVDFVTSMRTAIREPHNEALGILGRGGLFSLIPFLWFQLFFFIQNMKLMKTHRNSPQYGSFMAFLLALIIFTLITAIGETPFVMSFYSMPYYLSIGILLRMYQKRSLYFPPNTEAHEAPQLQTLQPIRYFPSASS